MSYLEGDIYNTLDPGFQFSFISKSSPEANEVKHTGINLIFFMIRIANNDIALVAALISINSKLGHPTLNSKWLVTIYNQTWIFVLKLKRVSHRIKRFFFEYFKWFSSYCSLNFRPLEGDFAPKF